MAESTSVIDSLVADEGLEVETRLTAATLPNAGRRLMAFAMVGLASVVGCASKPQNDSIQLTAVANSSTPNARIHTPQPPPSVDSPILDESSGLKDYLAYAAFHNARLEAAFNRWRAALERIPQVASLPDPRFTYRYFIREVETRVGPQEQGAGLTQTFPWFGKLALRGSAAGEAANAERKRYDAIKLDLYYDVIAAYNDYYYLGRAIAVMRENVDLIDYLEDVARARYRTDAATHSDVIRAQVELGKLEDQLDALRDLRGSILSQLNASLNRRPDAPLPFPSALTDERLAADDEAVLTMMAEHNPDLRALDHRVAQFDRDIELARKEYFPDITLGVDYTDVGQPPRPSAPGFANAAALRSASRLSGGIGDPLDAYTVGRSFTPGDRPDDAGSDIWMLSLSINIPIWHDKYAAGEREARARRLAAMADRRQREHDLAATVKRALYEYRDSERKIVLYRDTLIPKAKESIESTETAFRAGSVGFLELVDAERSLLDFGLSYERALANRSSRLAELDRLVGAPLPRQSTTNHEPDASDSDDPGVPPTMKEP